MRYGALRIITTIGDVGLILIYGVLWIRSGYKNRRYLGVTLLCLGVPLGAGLIGGGAMASTVGVVVSTVGLWVLWKGRDDVLKSKPPGLGGP